MNIPPPPPLPPQDPQQALACKYLAAAGLTFLIYDHIVSFDDEVELIWKAKWTFPKAIFLLLRYAVPCALIVHNYQLAGLKSVQGANTFCQVWFNIVVCLGTTTIAIGNFLVLLRLWVIRNRNRIFICSTFILFLLTLVATIVCVAIVMVKVTPSLMFDRGLSMCVLEQRNILGSLYGPPVVFDGLALATIFWNALSRSHGQGMSLMRHLHQDGFIFVLLLFLMRLLNFFTTLFEPLHLIFLTIYLIWATTTVTVSWLVLDIRRNGYSAKDTELDSD